MKKDEFRFMFTGNEVKALCLVVSADFKIYRDRVAHAASHGDEYVDSYGEMLGSVLEKLNG